MSAAPSETSIANAALTHLGERRIEDLNEIGKTASILNDKYGETRDELLRLHVWNFATKRVQIAADATAPLWGFSNQYTLPADCLRLVEVSNSENYDYRVEGRKILTDLGSPLSILYTRQVTSPIEMDVLFRQALAALLAAEVAESITGDNTKVDGLRRLALSKIREAKAPDGQESAPRHLEASEWLDAREEQGFMRNPPSGSGTPL